MKNVLYSTFVTPHMTCYIIVWELTYKSSLNSAVILQKKAVKSAMSAPDQLDQNANIWAFGIYISYKFQCSCVNFTVISYLHISQISFSIIKIYININSIYLSVNASALLYLTVCVEHTLQSIKCYTFYDLVA